MRRLARLTLLLWAVVPVILAAIVMAQHPFASPIIERTTTEAHLALTMAVARTVTPEWIGPRIEQALNGKDLQRLSLLNDMARENGVTLSASQRIRVDEELASLEGWRATTGNCIRCMRDVNACPDLTLIASCTIPFELSPAGDVAAVSRQTLNWLKGEEVDEVDAALGALGIAATATTVVSLGSGAPVKMGLTTLRVARKANAISPGLRRSLIAASKTEGGLRKALGDANRIRNSTSSGEVLVILRHADDVDELSRLARLSEVAGKDTRKALEALGKPRSLRLLNRVSDLTVAAIGLLALITAQIITLAHSILKLMLRRAIAPGRNR
ncbi:hypothetical protein EYF88_13350 [Paracoccus sediminis]|uniref:Uncharacterized protein n=1 Tax=Paracoccus sediminis TaxID=1214787 RepID=A0ABY1YG50_9RHOB|nr:hypothetical protein [Paracoccus sediminis]TBN48487.1 hypothetical protein EYF88_13350 [Paracoccus sediminis]